LNRETDGKINVSETSNFNKAVPTRQKISVPVLTYHSIDASGSVVSTAPETFRRQMEFLYQNGYRAVSLGELISELMTPKPPLPKTVALTFDDGFRNFSERAFPALEKYGFRATVFLVTDFCGRYNDWAGNPKELQRSKLLGWGEIKQLSEAGIEFGSHTRTHKNLTKCLPEVLEAEIVDSKKKIEDKLGLKTTTFAYPFGSFNRDVKSVAAENFEAACSTNLGKVRPESDLFALERIDTYYLSNPEILKKLPAKSFDVYLRVRQLLRDFKALINRS
jgi:peptidoglycan/xylan/chitin deacetylase (PgdA/CDA1 family)